MLQIFSVERAQEYDSLFARSSGWTGADGIYSIPLSGVELPGKWRRTNTLFVFSDTFWGEVDSLGYRTNTSMVNNTVAILEKNHQPPTARIRFFSGGTPNNPEAIFVPQTSSSTSQDFYWLKDGIHINNETHVFAARMSPVVSLSKRCTNPALGKIFKPSL